jgi:hypothetical protein
LEAAHNEAANEKDLPVPHMLKAEWKVRILTPQCRMTGNPMAAV